MWDIKRNSVMCFHLCLMHSLSKPSVESGSKELSSATVSHCPFRKKNHEQPELYQWTLFFVFQCLVLKNWGGKMVDEIESKGENQFWNWGTLLWVQASVLNMQKHLPE